MSKVYFISDLHLGHEGALSWAREFREGETAEEMNEWLVQQWNSVVAKRDVVYVLGDVAMKVEALECLRRMKGRKILVLGNHDEFDVGVYNKYFDKIRGAIKYKGFWLTHIPIHRNDIRTKRVRGNIHGHLHQSLTGSDFHYNVSVEHSAGVPVLFKDIVEGFGKQKPITSEGSLWEKSLVTRSVQNALRRAVIKLGII